MSVVEMRVGFEFSDRDNYTKLVADIYETLDVYHTERRIVLDVQFTETGAIYSGKHPTGPKAQSVLVLTIRYNPTTSDPEKAEEAIKDLHRFLLKRTDNAVIPTCRIKTEFMYQ